MVSPLCEVKDGAGAYVGTSEGVDVTPANTIIIRLADPNVNSWEIQCITTDDLNVAATIQAGLTIDSLNKTATFTAPAAGAALRFRSRVNGGIGPDGVTKPDYATTFCIYTLTGSGRTIALDETTEGGDFGWISTLNDIIRAGAVGGGVPGGAATELQYNNAGAFAGVSKLKWDSGATRVVAVSSGLEIANPGATFGYVLAGSAIVADRTVTLPLLAAGDTLVCEAFAQSLSNKTLASPTITGTVTYQGTRLRILSIPGEVQTADTTVTTIVSFAMADETLCAFDVVVCGARKTAVTKGGRWKRSAVYRRTGAGIATIVGGVESGTDEETDAGLDVTIDTDGANTVRVRVTGLVLQDINWTAELRVQETLAT